MSDGRLVIGNKRYSSWSLRGWLAAHLAKLDVEEVVVPLAGTGATSAVKDVTPNGLVPYLEHRGARVWESLAIVEYCAEHAPGLWPAAPVPRALARSVASEMHSGFRELRMAMPFNAGRAFPGQRRTEGALADIARIEALWAECLHISGGPYLFGTDFGAADAMFAPVVGRFLTWQPELSAGTLAYMAAVREHPLMRRWYDEALEEPAEWLLEKYENPA
jgi:glutathione S-transferase